MNIPPMIYPILFWCSILLKVTAIAQQQKNLPYVAMLPSGLGGVADILIIALVYLLIRQTKSASRQLSETISRATEADSRLSTQLLEIENTKQKVGQLRDEVHEMFNEYLADANLQARILFYKEEYKKAANILIDVAKSAPTAENNYWLGRCLLKSHQLLEARPYLGFAATVQPTADHLAALGEVECYLGDKDAIEHLKGALSMSGKKSAGEIHRLTSLLARIYGKYDPSKAKIILKELISDNPFKADAITSLVRILKSEKAYDEAIEVCNNAIEANPKNWAVYPFRAELLYLRGNPGDHDAVLADLETAESSPARGNKASLIRGQFHIDEANATTNKAEKNRILQQAVDEYEKGMNNLLKRFRAPLRVKQCEAFLLMGNYREALQKADLAVESSPHIENHLAYCWALMANKRWHAVREAAKRARDKGQAAGKIFSLIFELLSAIPDGNVTY